MVYKRIVLPTELKDIFNNLVKKMIYSNLSINASGENDASNIQGTHFEDLHFRDVYLLRMLFSSLSRKPDWYFGKELRWQ